MSKKTVLYIVHNHPSVRSGGAETYALELYEAMRDSSDYEPLIVAKAGPPVSATRQVHSGTPFGHVNGDPNQYFLHTEGEFDWFNGVLKSKQTLTFFFREFLKATRPDIVHFQHTQHFGYDMIREVRNTLPNAAIVYTLHEYLPICHHNGQMVRKQDNSLCRQSSSLRCHECFPEYSPQDFFMRQRFIQSQFDLVDAFVSPSQFLIERYVDWGIPRSKMVCEENGRTPMNPLPQPGCTRPRNRLAYFGQINPYKGVDVLLEAMSLLQKRQMIATGEFEPETVSISSAAPELRIHGANFEIQEGPFQEHIRGLLAETKNSVRLVGSYDQSHLPMLMADIDWVIIPSIWWENSPLVIKEAFGHRRPVICSDIGGMAEKVRDGVDGLHFRARSSVSLADTIERAVSTPQVWDQLVAGIPAIYSMTRHMEVLSDLYGKVLEQKL